MNHSIFLFQVKVDDILAFEAGVAEPGGRIGLGPLFFWRGLATPTFTF